MLRSFLVLAKRLKCEGSKFKTQLVALQRSCASECAVLQLRTVEYNEDSEPSAIPALWTRTVNLIKTMPPRQENNYGSIEKIKDEIVRTFEDSSNPYECALHILSNVETSDDFAMVVRLFHYWMYVIRDSYAHCLTHRIKLDGFRVASAHKGVFMSLFITTFGLRDLNEELRPLIEQLFAEKKYVESAQIITAFKLHNNFTPAETREILLNCLLCSEVSIVKTYLSYLSKNTHEDLFMCLSEAVLKPDPNQTHLLCPKLLHKLLFLTQSDRRSLAKCLCVAFKRDGQQKDLSPPPRIPAHPTFAAGFSTPVDCAHGAMQHIVYLRYGGANNPKGRMKQEDFEDYVKMIVDEVPNTVYTLIEELCIVHKADVACHFALALNVDRAKLSEKFNKRFQQFIEAKETISASSDQAKIDTSFSCFSSEIVGEDKTLSSLQNLPYFTLPEKFSSCDDDNSSFVMVDNKNKLVQFYADLDRQCLAQREEVLLGVDTEWFANLGFKSDPDRTSLIQFASADCVWLVDVKNLMGLLCHSEWKEFFDRVLHNEKLRKIGFSFHNDLRVLRSTFNFRYNSHAIAVDLKNTVCVQKLLAVIKRKRNTFFDHTHLLLGLGREKSPVRFDPGHCSLSVLSHHLLGKPLQKSCTLSNWNRRPLHKEQLHYAALDAYVLLNIYSGIRTLCAYNNLPFEELVVESFIGERKSNRLVEQTKSLLSESVEVEILPTSQPKPALQPVATAEENHVSVDSQQEQQVASESSSKPVQDYLEIRREVLMRLNQLFLRQELLPQPLKLPKQVSETTGCRQSQQVRLVLDQMCRRMAALLRLFGFDCIFVSDIEGRKSLPKIALEQDRCIVTRGFSLRRILDELPENTYVLPFHDRSYLDICPLIKHLDVTLNVDVFFHRCHNCNAVDWTTLPSQSIQTLLDNFDSNETAPVAPVVRVSAVKACTGVLVSSEKSRYNVEDDGQSMLYFKHCIPAPPDLLNSCLKTGSGGLFVKSGLIRLSAETIPMLQEVPECKLCLHCGTVYTGGETLRRCLGSFRSLLKLENKNGWYL